MIQVGSVHTLDSNMDELTTYTGESCGFVSNLVVDMQELVARDFLDPPTRCSLALTCTYAYERLRDTNYFGERFIIGSAMYGYWDLVELLAFDWRGIIYEALVVEIAKAAFIKAAPCFSVAYKLYDFASTFQPRIGRVTRSRYRELYLCERMFPRLAAMANPLEAQALLESSRWQTMSQQSLVQCLEGLIIENAVVFLERALLSQNESISRIAELRSFARGEDPKVRHLERPEPLTERSLLFSAKNFSRESKIFKIFYRDLYGLQSDEEIDKQVVKEIGEGGPFRIKNDSLALWYTAHWFEYDTIPRPSGWIHSESQHRIYRNEFIFNSFCNHPDFWAKNRYNRQFLNIGLTLALSGSCPELLYRYCSEILMDEAIQFDHLRFTIDSLFPTPPRYFPKSNPIAITPRTKAFFTLLDNIPPHWEKDQQYQKSLRTHIMPNCLKSGSIEGIDRLERLGVEICEKELRFFFNFALYSDWHDFHRSIPILEKWRRSRSPVIMSFSIEKSCQKDLHGRGRLGFIYGSRDPLAVLTFLQRHQPEYLLSATLTDFQRCFVISEKALDPHSNHRVKKSARVDTLAQLLRFIEMHGLLRLGWNDTCP